MEVIVVLIIVFSLISSLSKMTKKTNGAAQSGTTSGSASTYHKPRKQTPHTPIAKTGVPHAARIEDKQVMKPRAYQTIQPLVRETGNLDNYSGSLGAAGMEGEELMGGGSLGYTSTEGEDVCDPTLEHTRPERITPLADDVDVAFACPNVLPERFDGQELVRAVVMTEILNRPQQRLRRQ